jgi:uncharacterized protein (DUF2062 family)
MAKKLLRRYLPHPDTVRTNRRLRFLARWLHHPHLWHINRRGVSVGFAIGLFWAFMPMPLQMVPSSVTALVARANIPAAIAGAWVTNPLTMAPSIILCYQVGAWILGTPVQPLAVEASWQWFEQELSRVWQPFLLGCFVVGTLSAVLGYVGVRLVWRWQVIRAWERRSKKERR